MRLDQIYGVTKFNWFLTGFTVESVRVQAKRALLSQRQVSKNAPRSGPFFLYILNERTSSWGSTQSVRVEGPTERCL